MIQIDKYLLQTFKFVAVDRWISFCLFVEAMNKMGGPAQVIMTDGEGGIKNNALFQKIFSTT